MKFLLLAGVLYLVQAVSLVAQVNSPPYSPPDANLRPNPDTFSYDVGVNKYDGDTYLYLNPSFNMNFSNKWGFSLQVPMNILMSDKDPKYPKSRVGMLRPGDYNTREDYQRILNYVWLGKYGVYTPNKITYSVYAGKMFDGYIGHGTVINRYINNQRIDYYKIGVQADINTDYGGAQVFTNSVSDKEVNAGRAYVRPYGVIYGIYSLFSGKSSMAYLMSGNVIDEAGRKKVHEELDEDKEEKYIVVERDPNTGEMKEKEKTVPKKEDKDPAPPPRETAYDSIFNRFSIGVTSAFDGHAPSQLDFDTTGNLRYDKYNQPKVKYTKRMGIEGYDFEFKPIAKDWIQLTGYVDFNKIKHLDNARGRHTGVILKLGTDNYNITLRPEFRKMSSNYIPMYFDSFYEIERTQSNLGSSFPETKYESLSRMTPNGKEVTGYFHSVIINLKKIGLEASYEDYAGSNNSRVFAGVYIPIGSFFRLSGFYSKKGFDKSKEAFKPDDKAMGAGELALNLGPVTLKIQDRRTWIWDSTANKYQSRDEHLFLFSGGKSF